ncbi:zinc-finger domain-containing protein [Eikenella sp. S3360]|uniref:Zinc-finger domain-containing protein n=1 Tax=Eikenella glucosivorans TaxID=2766967 RepID=A0ABS0NCK1_9NEIS|nr:zinc-finger domain-containing protein [Eikenella glucosivorans]MBH5330033.1 zinc-finger domain-containing protein [Eikenella glucosivorans]
MPQQQASRLTLLTPHDLPLHCSGPKHETWNGHPRVFLPIADNGRIECPYCGSIYQLEGKAQGHH